MTFLHSYEFAIRAVRQARFPNTVKVHQPAGPIVNEGGHLEGEAPLPPPL